jgi:hypothetical protein
MKMEAVPKRIVALLMIKNESRIIARCIEHLKPIVDAFYFFDTGSTDNTIECIEDVFQGGGSSTPYKIGGESFVNFGVSRTASFNGCVAWVRDELGWDLDQTWSLAVDADMNLVVGVHFDKAVLGASGYSLIQKNPSITYYNMRLMRLSYPWRCVGATHEYWSGEGTQKLGEDYLYIDDRNDGGCKADKFERDERLLRAELEAEPANPRTHFYLAQTCESTGKKHEAIRLYKKRIELGGWYEEAWYAHYRIARNYKDLGHYAKMELWTERAYAYYKGRSEALYMCLEHFMNERSYEKAYYYYKKGVCIPYPKGDSLFIEDAVYNGGFDFQYTVMYYYIFPDNREKGSRALIEYVNRWPAHVKNTLENMMFYVAPVQGERTVFNFGDIDAYHVCNSSIVPYQDGYMMNVRYTDYRYKNGSYVWADGRSVNTKNYFYRLNREFCAVDELKEVHYSMAPDVVWRGAVINGFEDVRLIKDTESYYFYGSCSNLNDGGRIQMVYGRALLEEGRCVDVRELTSPQGRGCEKNWVFWASVSGNASAKDNVMKYIYEWSPYTLYSVDSEELVKKTMPRYMKEWRGSTAVMHYRGSWYCLVHMVIFREGRRNYVHMLVELDGVELVPRRHTLPFCFEGHGVEYCIGMVLDGPWARFIYTVNDERLAMKRVYFDNFSWVSVA